MRLAHLVLLALLVVPLAGADHLIHHRLYVVGRALDASGLPAPGLPVQLAFHGVEVGRACFDEEDKPTGPRGDFTLCRHAHPIPADAHVDVTVAGTTQRASIDEIAREAVAYVRTEMPAPGRDLQGDRDFNRTVRVEGGAYNRHGTPVLSEEELTDITARAGENATVRLVVGNETLQEKVAAIDDRGRYGVDLEVVEIPEGARVRVEVAGKQEGAEVDPVFRRVDVTVVRDLRPVTEAPTGRPGEVPTPLPVWVALAAVALSVAAARRRR